MRVGAQQPHRHVLMGAALDLPTRKHAGGVAVNQQRQQYRRRILGTAGAPGVDPTRSRVDRIHRVDHEVHQMAPNRASPAAAAMGCPDL